MKQKDRNFLDHWKRKKVEGYVFGESRTRAEFTEAMPRTSSAFQAQTRIDQTESSSLSDNPGELSLDKTKDVENNVPGN